MNFVDEETMLRTAEHYGLEVSRRACKAITVEYNKLIFLIAKRIIDVTSMFCTARARTVRPEHFYDAMKVAAMLHAPLDGDCDGYRRRPGSMVQQGGDPVLPMEYFGSSHMTPPDDIIRHSMSASAHFGPFDDHMTGGDPVLPPEYFGRGDIGGGRGIGGGGSKCRLDGAALEAVIKAYRASLKSSDIRISDDAKQLLNDAIEINVKNVLSQLTSKKLTVAVLRKAYASKIAMYTPAREKRYSP